MRERQFSAPYDATVKSVTVVVCVLLLALTWMIHIIYVAALMPLILVLAYIYSPRGYAIEGQAIVVKRLIGNVRVPLAEVRELRPGSRDDFTGAVRMWGNGGLFGFYGLYRTSKLGQCSWYVTDRSKTVIVVAGAKTLVISPDDVQGFIAAAGMPAPVSSGARVFEAPRGVRAYTGAIVGLAIGGLVLALVALMMTYAPGPPSYTLTSDALTIHDRFYAVTLPASAVDTDGMRLVDLSPGSEWRPAARTNGFANSHYQSGWFRVANGKTVRMYSAGAMRLVLIPPKGEGTYVLLQATDPDRFMEEVRRAWRRAQ